MANMYIAEDTKELLERVCKMESRTLEGQIKHFCKQVIEADKEHYNADEDVE